MTNEGEILRVVIEGNVYTVDNNGRVKGTGEKEEVADRTGIKVGDYIDYSPDETAQSTYSKDLLTDGYTGSSSNTADLARTNVQWQVLNINKDGSIDIIGTPTDFAVHFAGARGYNNGVYVMNDICEKMYSRAEIKARSINNEDMEKQLTEIGKTAKANDIASRISNLSTGTYITNIDKTKNKVTYIKEKSYYPILWKEQANEEEKYYKEETLIKEDGINKSYRQEENLDVEYTYYNIPINEANYGESAKVLSNENTFWVASRCADCYSDYAAFGLRFVLTFAAGYDMFTSSYYEANRCCCLRPVVTLGDNIQVIASEGENGVNNKHTINW